MQSEVSESRCARYCVVGSLSLTPRPQTPLILAEPRPPRLGRAVKKTVQWTAFRRGASDSKPAITLAKRVHNCRTLSAVAVAATKTSVQRTAKLAEPRPPRLRGLSSVARLGERRGMLVPPTSTASRAARFRYHRAHPLHSTHERDAGSAYCGVYARGCWIREGRACWLVMTVGAVAVSVPALSQMVVTDRKIEAFPTKCDGRAATHRGKDHAQIGRDKPDNPRKPWNSKRNGSLSRNCPARCPVTL